MCNVGSQPPSAILYPAESITAAYQTGRPVHTGHGLALSSRLGPYSTVAGPSGYLAAPSGTLSGGAATTTGTLQPLSHVPTAAQSQFHYIANPSVHPQQGHSVASMASPGSHAAFSSRPYGQVSQMYLTQPGTLQLQPSVGYHSPVISTSAPAYTQHQPQLSSIHAVTGTVGNLQQTLPSFSAPDTFSSSQITPHPQPQQVTQSQLTRPQWNTPSGF